MGSYHMRLACGRKLSRDEGQNFLRRVKQSTVSQRRWPPDPEETACWGAGGAKGTRGLFGPAYPLPQVVTKSHPVIIQVWNHMKL